LARNRVSDDQRLVLVRSAHTVIYVVMCASVIAVLFASIVGADDWWVWAALALVGIEVVVFAANGMRCPMTALAVRYGGASVSDTFLPRRLTRHTLICFGPLILIGLSLMAMRWWNTLF
jgi:hypothetical protein